MENVSELLKRVEKLRKKSPYSKFFWFAFSSIAGKYGPEKLRIRTLSFSESLMNDTLKWNYLYANWVILYYKLQV